MTTPTATAAPSKAPDDADLEPHTQNAPEGAKRATSPGKTAARKPIIRPWLRALHRDFGYLVVGLTLVYAASGLAVNHVADYQNGDANFTRYQRDTTLQGLTGDDNAIAEQVRWGLGITERPKEIFRAADDELQISFEHSTVTVHPKSGEVHEEGQRPRFFLRVANWLHLNRGKKAWTYVADGYAVLLIFLALSGLFMIPGRKGLFGRGIIIALVGAAIPVAYVQLSGGP